MDCKIKIGLLVPLFNVFMLSCSARDMPTTEKNHFIVPSRHDLMGDSLKLVENLIDNFQIAAKGALDTAGNFTIDVVNEAGIIRDKIISDIEKIKNQVNEAIDHVFQTVADASVEVKNCITTQKEQAAVVFNETITVPMMCVDQRIAEVGQQIKILKVLAYTALADADKASDSVQKCAKKENATSLRTGVCLGEIAIQTQTKSVGFLTKSTLLIARINLSITTIPASLEVCVGTRLLQTGIQIGQIIDNIGICAAAAIANSSADKD